MTQEKGESVTVTEFINTVDRFGTLSQAFAHGITPANLDKDAPEEFREMVLAAYGKWREYERVEDRYYTYCEECEYETNGRL